jgi:uncharacterized protein YfcZ (UPF0381/DUF406 family)
MIRTRYAVVESKDDITTVEATFDNREQAKEAALEFCKQTARSTSAKLDNIVEHERRVTFEDSDYRARVTPVDAYDKSETL